MPYERLQLPDLEAEFQKELDADADYMIVGDEVIEGDNAMSGYTLRDDGVWVDRETGEMLDDLPGAGNVIEGDEGPYDLVAAMYKDGFDNMDEYGSYLRGEAVTPDGIVLEDTVAGEYLEEQGIPYPTVYPDNAEPLSAEDHAAIDANEQAHADAVLADETEALDNAHQAWFDGMLDAGGIYSDYRPATYDPEYGTEPPGIIEVEVVEQDEMSGELILHYGYEEDDDDDLR